MTSCPIAVLFCASLLYAQDSATAKKDREPPQNAPPPADSSLVRRLETVTWSPATAELSWVVSVWDVKVSLDQPIAKQNYAVHLDSATMKFNGESRPFDPEEARHVRVLMYVISAYAVESTVWWDHGPDEKPADKTVPEPNNGEKGKGDNKPKAGPPAAVVLRGPVAVNRMRDPL